MFFRANRKYDYFGFNSFSGYKLQEIKIRKKMPQQKLSKLESVSASSGKWTNRAKIKKEDT